MLLSSTLGSLLLPPLNVVLLLLLGLWLLPRRPRTARTLIATAASLLLLLSLPLVSDALCRLVDIYPPTSLSALERTDADAVVVLAGGWRKAPEYGDGAYAVNSRSLQRLRYGVRLHRATGLPLALVGGAGRSDVPPESVLMAETLTADFGLAARWIETRSRNTAENARYAAELLLRPDGAPRVLLVTHAFHMARAVPEFVAQGFQVIPAPMGFCAAPEWRPHLGDLWPGIGALHNSYLALHELIGRAWYRVRYGA